LIVFLWLIAFKIIKNQRAVAQILLTVIKTFLRFNLGEVEDKRFESRLQRDPAGEFSKRLKRALD
jgi:hypothetical protein